MMLVSHILELLRKNGGKPLRSGWWIRTQFAQDKKRYLGRTPYWWESDVVEALDSGFEPLPPRRSR